MLRYLLFCAIALGSSTIAARAWNDTAHMIVAQIAYGKLAPSVRERVDELSKIGAEPENASFVTAACWPDDLKSYGIKTYNDWHFSDIPFSLDGTPVPQQRAKIDVSWAMNQCVFALKKRASDARFPNVALRPVPDAEKARMLRFLIHLVGDAHQPMHCVSRFSKAHPQGDRGGNDFLLGTTNLHAFWDSGGGLFNAIYLRPFSATSAVALASAAHRIAVANPPAKFPQLQDRNFAHWTQEGFHIAQSVAYDTPENRAPSADYTARVQKIAAQRVALAGYRLADLLNRIFEAE